MANWTALIQEIHDNIYLNTTGDIKGDTLQSVLDSIVGALGTTSGFKGVAVTTTVPPSLDGTAFYLASESGVYSNFGITIARKGIYVFEYQNGAWTSKTVSTENSISIMPWLNGTSNITLADNVLTFGTSGFTLLVGSKKYLITGDSAYTFSRVGSTTRGFLYFDLDKVKNQNDSYAVNWTSNNPFIVTTENLSTSGNYYLIASYYATGLFINDTQLAYSLNHDSITDGLNFPNQNKIYQQFGNLFCSALPQVYVTVDTASNLITIPIGFSVIGLTSKVRYTTTASQTCSVIPVNLSGVSQTSTMGILLFNTTDFTFVNLLYSETQPANTLIVGIVRRSELSSTKTGDVYIWGLENYKLDGVIKGNANNIIDRNRDIETIMLSAAKRINTTQRYTFAHISDVHGSIESMTNLATYVNNYPIQAVYNGGDMNSENVAAPMSAAMLSAIDRLTKPYYPILGNHDKGNGFLIAENYDNQDAYDNYIAPFLVQDGTNRITPAGDNLSYYKVDNSTYKIRTIFLNEFDNDLEDGLNYAVSHAARCFSQAQINWLIDCLTVYNATTNPDNFLPADYHVIIVMHQPPIYIANVPASGTTRSSFSYQGTVNYQGNKTHVDWILCDIINAFLNKTTLNKTYGFEPTLNTVTYNVSNNETLKNNLNANYSIAINTTFAYTTPKFVGYFFGHTHSDLVGFITEFTPSQAIIGIGAGTSVMSRTTDDNVSRVLSTKSQDLFNVCSVDTATNRLFIVRVGANIDSNLSVRKSAILNYVTGEFEGESLGDLTTDSFSINEDGELILTY